MSGGTISPIYHCAHRESKAIFSRQGWLIAIDMVGIGGKQRLQRRGLSPLREGHGVVRGRFIKPDKVQQVSACFRNLIPYGIRKRRIPVGEGRSPEEGVQQCVRYA